MGGALFLLDLPGRWQWHMSETERRLDGPVAPAACCGRHSKHVLRLLWLTHLVAALSAIWPAASPHRVGSVGVSGAAPSFAPPRTAVGTSES